MRSLLRTFGELWCRLMHSAIQWPQGHHYVCSTCGRLYPVPWANGGENTLGAIPLAHGRGAVNPSDPITS